MSDEELTPEEETRDKIAADHIFVQGRWMAKEDLSELDEEEDPQEVRWGKLRKKSREQDDQE